MKQGNGHSHSNGNGFVDHNDDDEPSAPHSHPAAANMTAMDNNNNTVDTDDFFGDQADSRENEEARRTRELEALRRPHFTAGVREGVSTAHEASLQDGFDDGFLAGVQAVTEASFLYVSLAIQ